MIRILQFILLAILAQTFAIATQGPALLRQNHTIPDTKPSSPSINPEHREIEKYTYDSIRPNPSKTTSSPDTQSTQIDFPKADTPLIKKSPLPFQPEFVAANTADSVLAPAKRTTGQTVLGKFPDYVNMSESLTARRFEIPTKIWNKMSPAEQWAANKKFLDRTISRGDDILLSNPVKNLDEVDGYFRRELDYLINQGYRLTNDGGRLVR